MSVLDVTNLTAGLPADPAPLKTNLQALESIAVPIGASMPYDGTGDPAGGRFLLRDGRLIDKTTYAGYFAAAGHTYNGGVDPGANKVRIGDQRGRVVVGADNMGTAQGAASRLVSNGARGNGGGEELHLLTSSEAAMNQNSQTCPLSASAPLGLGGIYSNAANIPQTGLSFGYAANPTPTQGGVARNADTSHNNMQPFQTTNYITRVL